MKNQYEVESEIRGLGKLVRASQPMDFNSFIEMIKNGRVPSIRDLAYARIALGKSSDVSRSSVSVREGILYASNFPPLVLFDSPLIESAERATNLHGRSKEVFVNPEDISHLFSTAIDNLGRDALMKKATFLPNQDHFIIYARRLLGAFPKQLVEKFQKQPISALNLEECAKQTAQAIGNFQLDWKYIDDATKFGISILKDLSVAYPLFLGKDIPVKVVNRGYVTSRSSPFLRQLQVRGINDHSMIEGEYNFLNTRERRYFIT